LRPSFRKFFDPTTSNMQNTPKHEIKRRKNPQIPLVEIPVAEFILEIQI
jgi:hypothetical protein